MVERELDHLSSALRQLSIAIADTLAYADSREAALAAEREAFLALTPPSPRPRFTSSGFHGDLAAAIALSSASELIDGTYDDAAEELVERSLDRITGHALGPGIQQGVAGLLLAVNAVSAKRPAAWKPYRDHLLAVLGEAIADPGLAGSSSGYESYDVISGKAGVALVASASVNGPAGASVAWEYAEVLAHDIVDHGVRTFLVDATRYRGTSLAKEFPGLHLNLGAAHGLVGVLGALEAVARASCRSSTADEAAEIITSKLANSLIQDEHGIALPSILPETGPPPHHPPTRLGWCNGLAGLATVIEARESSGQSLPAHLSTESLWDTLVRRAHIGHLPSGLSLCHGLTGISHLASRSSWMARHRANDQAYLAEKARERLLKSYVRGHPAVIVDAVGDWRVCSTTLLDGIAGYLPYVASQHGGSTSWDCFFGPAGSHDDKGV